MKKLSILLGISFILILSLMFLYLRRNIDQSKENSKIQTGIMNNVSSSDSDLSYIVVHGSKTADIELFDEHRVRISESFIQEPIQDPISGNTNEKMAILEYSKPLNGKYILKNSFRESIEVYLYDRVGNVKIDKFFGREKDYEITFDKENVAASRVEPKQ